MGDTSFVSTVPQAPANFDALPCEVLDLILSFIKMSYEVEYLDEKGHLHTTSQPIALMHVCRTLRRAVLRAKFWHEYGFEFARLVWPPQFEERRLNFLYKALFAEDDFLENLESKRDWTFSEPEIITDVLAAYPNFLSTVRRLRLDMTTDINFALRRVSSRNEITELNIAVWSSDYLDLSLIQCFNVRHLDLEIPEHYYGELTDQSGLQSYKLHAVGRDVKIPNGSLPLASADTLTFLHLKGYVSPDFTLESFTNLDFLGYELSPYDDLRRDGFLRHVDRHYGVSIQDSASSRCTGMWLDGLPTNAPSSFCHV